jgi:hypothetical protein
MTNLKKSAEEYATRGPFFQLFRSPEARVLDQACIVGWMRQTVSMLAESANLTPMKTREIVRRLRRQGLIRKGTRQGRIQAYRFNVEKEPLKSLILWATKVALTPSRRWRNVET